MGYIQVSHVMAVFPMKSLIIVVLVSALVLTAGCGTDPGNHSAEQVSGIVWRTDSMMAVLAECPEAGADSACVRIAHRWVVPVDRLSSVATDSLAAATMRLRLAGDSPDEASSIDAMVELMFDSFREVHREFPDMPVGWFDELDVTLACDRGEWFAVRADRFWYGGGAHPNTVRRYVAIDRSTGRTIPWRERVDTAALLPRAEAAFRQTRDLPPTGSLNDQGWFFPEDRFTLPTEGMVCGDRITLYWNPYEVGPYAVGPTEITVAVE